MHNYRLIGLLYLLSNNVDKRIYSRFLHLMINIFIYDKQYCFIRNSSTRTHSLITKLKRNNKLPSLFIDLKKKIIAILLNKLKYEWGWGGTSYSQINQT